MKYQKFSIHSSHAGSTINHVANIFLKTPLIVLICLALISRPLSMNLIQLKELYFQNLYPII